MREADEGINWLEGGGGGMNCKLERMVRLAMLLSGAGLCAVATFGEFKALAGACIVEVLGLAVGVISFFVKPNAEVTGR